MPIVVPLQLSPADVNTGILAVSRGKIYDGLTTIPQSRWLRAALTGHQEKGCRIQTSVDMFQGNLGLMARFSPPGRGTG